MFFLKNRKTIKCQLYIGVNGRKNDNVGVRLYLKKTQINYSNDFNEMFLGVFF